MHNEKKSNKKMKKNIEDITEPVVCYGIYQIFQWKEEDKKICVLSRGKENFLLLFF